MIPVSFLTGEYSQGVSRRGCHRIVILGRQSTSLQNINRGSIWSLCKRNKDSSHKSLGTNAPSGYIHHTASNSTGIGTVSRG